MQKLDSPDAAAIKDLEKRSQLSLRNLVTLKRVIKHLYLKLFGYVIKSSKL
jgi:hypothetical protein